MGAIQGLEHGGEMSLGGNGTSKDKKTGEWGVSYNQVDGTGETAGQAVSRFQTKGARPENIDETRERVVGEMQQSKFEKDNQIVSQTETGWVRNVDGSSIDKPISGMARLKSLANALSITSFNTTPGAIKVPEMDISDMPFDKLQKMAGSTGRQMPRFFKGTGAIPSKQALKIYRELATRMLTGTGGAYQRLTDAARLLHAERIKMIDEALKTMKN